MADVETFINKKELIEYTSTIIEKRVPAFEVIDEPMYSWTKPYEELVLERWIPKGIEVVEELLLKHLDKLLKHLKLEEIIRDQVQAFSLEHLESLIVSIAKRELKLIMYLGGLIGAVIGLFQGIIVLLLG